MNGSPDNDIDRILDFILSDDSPLDAADLKNVKAFDNVVSEAEARVAHQRLARARAGAMAYGGVVSLNDFGRARAKLLLDRAKAGDKSAGLTLAARFGDGSMDQDMDAMLEDIAELLDEDDEG